MTDFARPSVVWVLRVGADRRYLYDNEQAALDGFAFFDEYRNDGDGPPALWITPCDWSLVTVEHVERMSEEPIEVLLDAARRNAEHEHEADE